MTTEPEVRMNPEIKKRWVEALRSGKYKQGTAVLHDVTSDTYCCLGVLCDIAMQDGIVTGEPPSGFARYAFMYRSVDDPDDVNATSPPASVVAWAGLPVFDPTVVDGDDPDSSLMTMNDADRRTFERIADVIEEQL
jgi:hypothetical protein